MKKKVLIGVGIFVVIVAAAFVYLNNRNRTMSPSGLAELTVGDLKVSIPYSRPSMRGRTIFGSDASKVLLPYGKYWRLGANETTQITFSKDVTFNGEPVKAGTYRIYAIPGEENFEVRLNSDISLWGYSEPDYSKDFIKTPVKANKTSSSVEQFTINLTEADGGINMTVEWADTQLVIPIKAQ
jgi:hypothetical protein